MGPDSVRETQSHLGTRNALLCQLTSDDGDAGESRVTGSPPLRLGADGARDGHACCRFIADPPRASLRTELEAKRAQFYTEDRALNLATSQWDLTYNRVRTSD